MTDSFLKYPGYILRRAANAAKADLDERLSVFGLRQGNFSFLRLIDDSPGMSQSEAGRLLGIKSANMVAFASRLEQAGLLNRESADGRSLALSLTPKGRATLEESNRIVAEFERDLLQRVPESMRSMVIPILMAIWNPSDSD